jgi:hypothetical protein
VRERERERESKDIHDLHSLDAISLLILASFLLLYCPHTQYPCTLLFMPPSLPPSCHSTLHFSPPLSLSPPLRHSVTHPLPRCLTSLPLTHPLPPLTHTPTPSLPRSLPPVLTPFLPNHQSMESGNDFPFQNLSPDQLREIERTRNKLQQTRQDISKQLLSDRTADCEVRSKRPVQALLAVVRCIGPDNAVCM